ncbi:MAG: aspartate aminotransferase family protein [Dehalococcoidales bacterium]|jgi:glutamate-1-semialdehyde 2,1-aminomutase|nr:aspartate aminotransferase family protein [Dehalococcoidales bacterium]
MAVDRLVDEYKITHPKSQELHDRAARIFAADGATARIRILNPYRPYITHAKGSKKWDIDGNEYIDYVMGHGAMLLGHSHPAIVKALQEQAAKGTHYGDNHELEVAWAELIQSMVPSAERVEFFACGQEANLFAIKLARIFTQRSKILRFVENFHGWADELVPTPISPSVVADAVKIIPYDLDRVEEELATKEYAILMTEGGGAHMSGQIPLDFEFVRTLPGLAHKYGTVWFLDEVVTGFRDAPGGFQSIVGVKSDLTSLGKIVAGGIGAGALVGRADIMGLLSPETPANRRMIHTGTWNANPLASATGIAALKLCQDGKPQRKANEMAASLRKEGNQLFKEKGVDGWLYGRSITHVYLGPFDCQPTDDTVPPTKDISKITGMGGAKTRLSHHLLHRGISTMAARHLILSCMHTIKDVNKTVDALADSLDAMIEEGSIKSRS